MTLSDIAKGYLLSIRVSSFSNSSMGNGGSCAILDFNLFLSSGVN